MDKDFDTQSVSSVGSSNEDAVFNGVAVIIKCVEHKRLALMRLQNKKYLWFPFAKTYQKEDPREAVDKLVKKALDFDQDVDVNMSTPESVQLTRFQIYESGKSNALLLVVYHFRISLKGPYYEVELFSTNVDEKQCCKDSDSVQWYTKVSVNEPGVWGPGICVSI